MGLLRQEGKRRLKAVSILSTATLQKYAPGDKNIWREVKFLNVCVYTLNQVWCIKWQVEFDTRFMQKKLFIYVWYSGMRTMELSTIHIWWQFSQRETSFTNGNSILNILTKILKNDNTLYMCRFLAETSCNCKSYKTSKSLQQNRQMDCFTYFPWSLTLIHP